MRRAMTLAFGVVTLYAAYGTNLDPARMGERCPHSPLNTTGWLEGWRLTFGGEEHGWDGALSTIVQDSFEQVYVAVYDVTKEDEVALDGWESADSGLYRKTKVRVSTMTGEQVAWTYVLDAYEGGRPSAEAACRIGDERFLPSQAPDKNSFLDQVFLGGFQAPIIVCIGCKFRLHGWIKCNIHDL